MVHQLGLPTFIVISTSIERLWDFFNKNLHTLHASKLNLQNKIKKPPTCSYNKIDMN
jgi:hypothetical protein